MSGRALVTGGTRGLGKAIAMRLAQSGKAVVIVSRDGDRGAVAADEIRRLSGEGAVDVLIADLAQKSEVRRLARETQTSYPDLDLLINNAGVSKFTREVTRDGLETTFATNHMAPFLLSNLLLDVLSRNRPSIILNVTSEQHRFVRAIPWDDLQGERRFQPLEQYSLTKLYNILFTAEIARRAEALGVNANCVSPGFLRTDLGREARGGFRLFLTLARPFRRPPESGAKAVMKLLQMSGTGTYFRGEHPRSPSALAQDPAAAARLWEISSALVGSGVEAGQSDCS